MVKAIAISIPNQESMMTNRFGLLLALTGLAFLAFSNAAHAADYVCNGAEGSCEDKDNDGVPGNAVEGADCDDNNAAVYPGADVVIGDGVDNACLGDADADAFAALADRLDVEFKDSIAAVDQAEIMAAAAAYRKIYGPAGELMLVRGIAGCVDDVGFGGQNRWMRDADDRGTYWCYDKDGNSFPAGYEFVYDDSGVAAPVDLGQDRRIGGAYARANAAKTAAESAQATADAAMAKAENLSRVIGSEGSDGSEATGLIGRVGRVESDIADIDRDNEKRDEDIAALQGTVHGIPAKKDKNGKVVVPGTPGLVSRTQALEGVSGTLLDEVYGVGGTQEKPTDGALVLMRDDVAALKRSGLSLGIFAGGGYNAVSGMSVDVCVQATDAGCTETAPRSISDGGYGVGQFGLYIANNMASFGRLPNDSRVELDVLGSLSTTTGQAITGETAKFNQQAVTGQLVGVTGIGGNTVLGGIYVGGGASVLGWNALGVRADGFHVTGGLSGRLEAPIHGPFEAAFRLNVGPFAQKAYTVVDDESGTWIPAPQWSGGVLVTADAAFGFGPAGR